MLTLKYLQENTQEAIEKLKVKNFDATEIEPNKLADRFIMIAGYENNLGAFFSFFHHQLHDIIMGLMPVPAALELPAIDNIADQIQFV